MQTQTNKLLAPGCQILFLHPSFANAAARFWLRDARLSSLYPSFANAAANISTTGMLVFPHQSFICKAAVNLSSTGMPDSFSIPHSQQAFLHLSLQKAAEEPSVFRMSVMRHLLFAKKRKEMLYYPSFAICSCKLLDTGMPGSHLQNAEASFTTSVMPVSPHLAFICEAAAI